MLLISSGASPEFVNVTNCGGYGPCGFGLPKVTLDGVNLAAGAAADAPVGIETAARIAVMNTIGRLRFMTRHLSRGWAPMRGSPLSGFPPTEPPGVRMQGTLRRADPSQGPVVCCPYRARWTGHRLVSLGADDRGRPQQHLGRWLVPLRKRRPGRPVRHRSGTHRRRLGRHHPAYARAPALVVARDRQRPDWPRPRGRQPPLARHLWPAGARCRLRSVALLRLSALRMAAGQRDRRGPDSGARSGPPRPTILVHRGAGSASHYPDRRLRSR